MEIKNKKKRNIKYQLLKSIVLKYFIIHEYIKIKIIFFFILFLLFFYKTKTNIIPIAYALNNEFTLPLIVSLTSILYNRNNNTFYYFYIMIPNDFLKENKKKLMD